MFGREIGLPFFSGCKPADTVLFVQPPVRTVDPPEAQRFLHRVIVGQAFLAGSLQRKHKPDFRRRFKAVGQVFPPFASFACIKCLHPFSFPVYPIRFPNISRTGVPFHVHVDCTMKRRAWKGEHNIYACV